MKKWIVIILLVSCQKEEMNLLIHTFFSNAEIITDKSEILASTSHGWFARPKVLVNNRTIWVCQVHDDGGGYSQNILELNADSGAKTVTKVGSVIHFDDHNEPTILVRSSDNRLFCCYSEHSGTLLRTRISTNPLDATSWQTEKTYDLGFGGYTYPSCFEDASGNIWIFIRDDETGVAPRGWSYQKSTDGGETFSGWVLFFFGDGARGYVHASQDLDDKDIIHFVATGGHPVNATVCDIFHFYFDCSDSTLHKSDGTDVTASIPLTGSSDMTVIMNNTLPDTGWIEDILIVSGKPRVLMTFLPNAKNVNYLTKDLYYSEWSGSAWSTPYKIHTAMSGYIEDDDPSLQSPMYPPLASFMRSNPNVIIASKRVDGVAEIFKITKIASDNFSSEQLTFDSSVDQWRPITANINKRNVFWQNKTLYNHWQNDYNQELINATVQ